MSRIKIWLLAARPKTLGVSLAPVMMGGAIAFRHGFFHAPSFFVAMLSALCIQIGTNFCNDYFDFIKGADTVERIGPARATQSGWVTPLQMRNAFVFAFGCAAVLGTYLVFRGGWPILLVGVASIVSGLIYTAGPYPLAYVGMSELFVVVFFGPVAVAGTYYVQALRFSGEAFFAGFAPGLLSMAILCVNNLRDRVQDQKVNKKTLAVRFGERFAQYEYVTAVTIAGGIPFFLHFYFNAPLALLFSTLALAMALPLIRRVLSLKDPAALNGVLAKTGQLTLLFGVVFALGYLI